MYSSLFSHEHLHFQPNNTVPAYMIFNLCPPGCKYPWRIDVNEIQQNFLPGLILTGSVWVGMVKRLQIWRQFLWPFYLTYVEMIFLFPRILSVQIRCTILATDHSLLWTFQSCIDSSELCKVDFRLPFGGPQFKPFTQKCCRWCGWSLL